MCPNDPDSSLVVFQDVVAQRRSATAFDPNRSISPAVLERVLASATLAPSSFNLQPWRFLVVQDPANRRRLRACTRNDPRSSQASVAVIVLGYHHPDRTHLEASLAMRIAADAADAAKAGEIRGRVRSTFRDLDEDDRRRWSSRSAMLAAATMMLAAESQGIASALIDVLDSDLLRREFGVPDDHSIGCLVALGHPEGEKPSPGRFGLDEIVFREHFGRPWAP